jgi:hypothetical protein
MAHSSNAFVGSMSVYRALPDTRRAQPKHSCTPTSVPLPQFMVSRQETDDAVSEEG